MSIIEAPTPTRTVTEADVLERAADLLEEFGWCQGQFARSFIGAGVDPHSAYAVSFCAAGAIRRSAAEISEENNPLCVGHHFLDHLCRKNPNFLTIPSWNDEDGRTKAEVVAELRAAAEGLR